MAPVVPDPKPVTFTGSTMVVAEGARVALFNCQSCGAAILQDPRDPVDHRKTHEEFHASLHKRGHPW